MTYRPDVRIRAGTIRKPQWAGVAINDDRRVAAATCEHAHLNRDRALRCAEKIARQLNQEGQP